MKPYQSPVLERFLLTVDEAIAVVVIKSEPTVEDDELSV